MPSIWYNSVGTTKWECMRKSIWTNERIAALKRKHGVKTVFLLKNPDYVPDDIGYDAAGFEKDDRFWLAKGSVVAPIIHVSMAGSLEYEHKIEDADEGAIFKHVAQRDLNLYNREFAARYVKSEKLAFGWSWEEA